MVANPPSVPRLIASRILSRADTLGSTCTNAEPITLLLYVAQGPR